MPVPAVVWPVSLLRAQSPSSRSYSLNIYIYIFFNGLSVKGYALRLYLSDFPCAAAETFPKPEAAAGSRQRVPCSMGAEGSGPWASTQACRPLRKRALTCVVKCYVLLMQRSR